MFAVLEFGNNELCQYYAPSYSVVKYTSEILRTYDCCLPHADPRCKQFEIVVNSPDKTDLNLIEWFIGGGQKCGKITFILAGESSSDPSHESVIYFEDAYCSAIAEHYDITNNALRQLKMTIVPMSFRICDVEFNRPE